MSVFQTKAWQSAWWETWGEQKGFRLIRPWNGEVSGLYQSGYRLKGLLPIRSLQFVGTSSREVRTPRTEHNLFFKGSSALPLMHVIEGFLEDCTWSEAVFTDLSGESKELSALIDLAAAKNWGFRITASDDGYSIATTGSFEDYLTSLGSNTRLRLHNRRAVLKSLGEVREENFWPDKQDAFFRMLNDYHRVRWKKDCVTATSLAFHKTFLSRVEEEGGRPMLSVLMCSDKVVSLLYNVWHRGVVYNIQAGFEEQFHKKLSLGSLHLGYALESAFHCPETYTFDLLAGKGKREDYKARIATETYQFLSVMLVKSTLLRALYRIRG